LCMERVVRTGREFDHNRNAGKLGVFADSRTNTVNGRVTLRHSEAGSSSGKRGCFSVVCERIFNYESRV